MNKRVAELWERLSGVNVDIKSLRRRILGGENSLRSNLDNFLFCWVGIDPERWKPYLELNELVKSSEGKEILVVCGEEVDDVIYRESPHVLSSREDRATFVFNHNYGVLSGGGLGFNYKEPEIVFPTGRQHVNMMGKDIFQMERAFDLNSIEKVRGKIRKKGEDLIYLCGVSRSSFLSDWGKRTSMVLVGNDVLDYFNRTANGKKCYSNIMDKLA